MPPNVILRCNCSALLPQTVTSSPGGRPDPKLGPGSIDHCYSRNIPNHANPKAILNHSPPTRIPPPNSNPKFIVNHFHSKSILTYPNSNPKNILNRSHPKGILTYPNPNPKHVPNHSKHTNNPKNILNGSNPKNTLQSTFPVHIHTVTRTSQLKSPVAAFESPQTTQLKSPATAFESTQRAQLKSPVTAFESTQKTQLKSLATSSRLRSNIRYTIQPKFTGIPNRQLRHSTLLPGHTITHKFQPKWRIIRNTTPVCASRGREEPSENRHTSFPRPLRLRLPDLKVMESLVKGGPGEFPAEAAPPAPTQSGNPPSQPAASHATQHTDSTQTWNGSAAGHHTHAARLSSPVVGSRPLEWKLDELRRLIGKKEGDPLKVVGVGAGSWGSVFVALLQEAYGGFKDKIDVKIWRRANKALEKEFAQQLFQTINSREDIIRRLIRKCAYLKYVEARLGDRVLYADEILRDGFCVNIVDTPLCPLHVVTNLQEAVWDADVVINGLPSTETRGVFREIGKVWRERTKPPAVVVSLAKGVEAGTFPEPHIVTPTLMIHQEAGVPMENLLYLGGPNIASEIYHKEYANARLCGASKWRKPLAAFFRQRNFIVWDNEDLVTHEVMGGLKNVYAIGAGIVAGVTQDSATSKSVYFAHATSEMVFVTHLLSPNPERLAGPLLADTYVTLLKGRNAWYGQQLASGALTAEMGDYAKGKGLIQGVSAVEAFHQVLSQPLFKVPHPVTLEMVLPVELCPILQQLYHILQVRDSPPASILERLRDEHMYDPAERIAIAPESCYRSKLLERHPSSRQNEESSSSLQADGVAETVEQ